MEDEHRGVALVILGIIAVIAVMGLVLMFTNSNGSTGAIFTSATGGNYICPMDTNVGEPQWFPANLAGPFENKIRFLKDWTNAGYECIASPTSGIDEYGYADVYCCRNPADVPVSERGPVPLTTRQGSGVPVGAEYMGNYQYAVDPEMQHSPRIGP